MKIYTIIAGVNGAGKSSLTGALKAERNDLGQIIDVDKITASLGGRAIEGGKAAIHKKNDQEGERSWILYQAVLYRHFQREGKHKTH